MTVTRIIAFLLSFHAKKHSAAAKLFSLFCGTLFFLILLPTGFILFGLFLQKYIAFHVPPVIEYACALPALGIGIPFLCWAARVQWTIGEGTPAPNMPTQRLVTAGPYRLCRNPIELGAILYYFGIGTLSVGMQIGLVCFLLGLAFGSAYHKCIEEKELERRFGEEYLEYKRQTPFLFPKIGKF